MTQLLRVRTTFPSVGGGALSTHYFGPWPGSGTIADVNACITRVGNFWTALNSRMWNNASWTVNGQVDLINDADGVLTGSLAGTSVAGVGTGATDPLPQQNQGLVAWQTATIADGHRLAGQTYIPSPLEADSTAGNPISTYVTALGTAAAAMLVTGTFNLCIWHRPLFNSAGAVVRAGSYGLVTAGAGRGTWSVLRSRR